MNSTPPLQAAANGHDGDKALDGYDPPAYLDSEHAVQRISADQLARKLSARQVSMIAIGGTIGTGLFLGTPIATSWPARC